MISRKLTASLHPCPYTISSACIHLLYQVSSVSFSYKLNKVLPTLTEIYNLLTPEKINADDGEFEVKNHPYEENVSNIYFSVATVVYTTAQDESSKYKISSEPRISSKCPTLPRYLYGFRNSRRGNIHSRRTVLYQCRIRISSAQKHIEYLPLSVIPGPPSTALTVLKR